MEVLSFLLKAVGVFTIWFLLVYFSLNLWNCYKVKKRRRKRGAANAEAAAKEKPVRKIKINKMDVMLGVIFVTLVAFTLKMIDLFETYQMIPDTLVTCVFAVCGGECGAMSWIKTSKEKYQERRWQLEDERRMEEEANRAASVHSEDP